VAVKWYLPALEAALEGNLNLLTADVRAVCVDAADYTFAETHDFLDDIPGGARVATSGTLQNVTVAVTSGEVRVDADDIEIAGVTGDQFEAVVLYVHDGGADSARRLVCYIDSGTGLPFTPSGGAVLLRWNASGIAYLANV